ncbi:hypothetical protein PLCT2_02964 [Planctomycetaceae bacterium]|nr:hypothetical protein PLCT2_02964 [Planctomycetaceae bacterium]
MGQYYFIVNIDKKEFLHPHKLGDGLKLMEFAGQGDGTMLALGLLLADGCGRGGGDFHARKCSNPDLALIGRWKGDRIVVAGDYADPGFTPKPEEWTPEQRAKLKEHFSEGTDLDKNVNLYAWAESFFEDISLKMRALMECEAYVELRPRWDRDRTEELKKAS